MDLYALITLKELIQFSLVIMGLVVISFLIILYWLEEEPDTDNR